MRLYFGGQPGLKVGARLRPPVLFTPSLAVAAFNAASFPNGALYEVRVARLVTARPKRVRRRSRSWAGDVHVADVISPRVPWSSAAAALRTIVAAAEAQR